MKTTITALGLSAVMASAAAAQDIQTPQSQYNADDCVMDIFFDVIDSLADLKEQVDTDGISLTGMTLTYTQDQLDGFVADCEQETGTKAIMATGLQTLSDGFTTIEIEP